MDLTIYRYHLSKYMFMQGYHAIKNVEMFSATIFLNWMFWDKNTFTVYGCILTDFSGICEWIFSRFPTVFHGFSPAFGVLFSPIWSAVSFVFITLGQGNIYIEYKLYFNFKELFFDVCFVDYLSAEHLLIKWSSVIYCVCFN